MVVYHMNKSCEVYQELYPFMSADEYDYKFLPFIE